MQVIQTNWDVDWSNCFVVEPKRGRMRMCNTCHEEHDIKCFFTYRGGFIGCMINKASRGKAMAKIKGSAK